jgi:putative heme iron utilization protein
MRRNIELYRLAAAVLAVLVSTGAPAAAHHHGEADWRRPMPGSTSLVRVQAQVPAARQTTPPPALCPTPEQSAKAAAAIAQSPAAMPPNAARAIGMPELAYVGALPAEQRVLVSGGAFPQVWQSLQQWPDALTLIMKGPNVFEIFGPVNKGENSARSAFFNLEKGEKGGVAGHLRPDLYSAAAVIALKNKEGTTAMRGVLFYDAAGESVFGVFVPAEGAQAAPPATMQAFEATWALAKTLPAVCN